MDSNNSDQEHVKYHHGGKRRGSGRKDHLIAALVIKK